MESNCFSRPTSPTKFFALQQLMDGDEVAEALRHLLPLDLEEAVMHPDLRHHFRPMRAARLGDLVLMMRKHEVDAAAMNVEGLAEMRRRHGRALDMPAR